VGVTLPRERSVGGRFGSYGGRYVPETLMAALDQLAALYDAARTDQAFWAEFDLLLKDFVGRPSLLVDAPRFSEVAGARVLLKREDLNHTGAHKINNTIGQALPGSGSNAWSTWERRMSSGRRSTCIACGCSAPPWCRSTPAPAP